MADREKVMEALDCRANDTDLDCRKCDYYIRKNVPGFCKFREILRDAYELLKEQEAVKRTYRTGINGFSIIWTCGACGSDLYPNNAKAKYCSNCGQAVKWE